MVCFALCCMYVRTLYLTFSGQYKTLMVVTGSLKHSTTQLICLKWGVAKTAEEPCYEVKWGCLEPTQYTLKLPTFHQCGLLNEVLYTLTAQSVVTLSVFKIWDLKKIWCLYLTITFYYVCPYKARYIPKISNFESC